MRISIIKNKGRVLAGGFWLILWEIVSRLVDNKILLPGPREVTLTLGGLVREDYFFQTILNSSRNIGLGLVVGIGIGLFLGVLSYRRSFLKDLIDLPMEVIKSIPMASIVVLMLIWFRSDQLPSLVVFLIVLPNIYYSTLEGLESVDRELLEMSKVFRVRPLKLIRYLYFEKLKKTLLPSIIVSSGLAWKTGVSAEVLGLVKDTVGENIYYSKIYLDTRELFAWTFIIVVLSNIFLSFLEYLMGKVNG